MNTALRSEELDVRTVFKVHAAVAWIAGVFLLGWGPRFFPLQLVAYPQGAGLVVRVIGAVLVAAGFCAWAVNKVEAPAALKQALLWWSVGHTTAFSALVIQVLTVMGEPKAGGGLALGGLLTASITGWYAYMTTDGIPMGRLPDHQTLFGNTPEASVTQLRSAYEERIRAAAAQEERNRLARDLHDSIKQQIFVIQTAAATAQARFEADPAGAASAVEQVRSSAREAMTEMEVMLDQWRASPLENTGLVEALRRGLVTLEELG
jgi:signal transduction histidine kinase